MLNLINHKGMVMSILIKDGDKDVTYETFDNNVTTLDFLHCINYGGKEYYVVNDIDDIKFDVEKYVKDNGLMLKVEYDEIYVEEKMTLSNYYTNEIIAQGDCKVIKEAIENLVYNNNNKDDIHLDYVITNLLDDAISSFSGFGGMILSTGRCIAHLVEKGGEWEDLDMDCEYSYDTDIRNEYSTLYRTPSKSGSHNGYTRSSLEEEAQYSLETDLKEEAIDNVIKWAKENGYNVEDEENITKDGKLYEIIVDNEFVGDGQIGSCYVNFK